MPAQRTYVVTDAPNDTDVLRFSVKGDLEQRRSVYFTDQSPIFIVTVENLTDKPVDGDNWVRLIFDESDSKHESSEQINCTLEPDKTAAFAFKQDMLSYQGNAAIGVHTMTASKDGDHYSTRRKRKHIERLYTFMVYDRDYYKLNYLRPRYAQYLAAFLTVLVVVVGVAQFLNSVGGF